MEKAAACELCDTPGGELVVRSGDLRVVLVDNPLYPGFCRVIHNDHIRELTDLPPAGRSQVMMAVCKVESVLRDVMAPDKVNLASFGNQVPHLHWHVIPRYVDDVHFPSPVWGAACREPEPSQLDKRRQALPALRAALVRAFSEES